LTTVIDANLLIALIFPTTYTAPAEAHITKWQSGRELMIAPTLLWYEIDSAIRQQVHVRRLAPQEALFAMDKLRSIQVSLYSPTLPLSKAAIQWAGRIGHAKCYDAHYLALAEQERAEFWTADQRLRNAAHAAGATWVHWIGQTPDGR
jgi:predicted nucleic acid-binding protein